MLSKLNDLYNHGVGSGKNGGIGRHMLMYRSHQGRSTSNFPTISLQYYQDIYAGDNFNKIAVIDTVTDEIVTKTPVIVNEDTIQLVTATGRPLEYGRTYTVSIPAGAVNDKRKTSLMGLYTYDFTVDINKGIIYVVNADMSAADITTLLNQVADENSGSKNIIVKFPSKPIVISEPIMYPNNTTIIGANLVFDKTVNTLDITVLAPQDPGLCKLTLDHCVIDGTVVGENLNIMNSNIFSIMDSKDYVVDEDAVIRVSDSVVAHLTMLSYTTDVIINNSKLCYNGEVNGGLYLSGANVRIADCDIISDSGAMIIANEFSIMYSDITTTKPFDISNVIGSTKIIGCDVNGYGPFIYRGAAYNNVFTESNVTITECNMTGVDVDANDNILIDMGGDTLPDVYIRNNIVSGIDDICYYRKETEEDFLNEYTPVMCITGNIIPELSFVRVDDGMYQVIDIQINYNNTRSELTLPSNYFRGMVNANIAIDNKLTSTPDLLVRDNLLGRG